MVKKAVVLAAGFGTRLKPFTATVPKPLMPVWGECMLGRIVEMLRSWGVEDIVINAHHLHERISEWAKDNGCKVSVETEILGTGGVLNPLRDWLGKDDFYLVNSDIVVEGVERLSFRGDELGVAYVTTLGPQTIEVESESGFVTCWSSPDPGWSDTYTYTGIALLKNRVLDFVEGKGFSSIVTAYEKAMMQGEFIRAVKKDELLWSDAGTIDAYIALNEDEEDNAFAEIPHLKALGVSEAKFLGVRGSERAFFRAKEGIAIVYDDSSRKENSKYVRHARWLKAKGVGVPAVLADSSEYKATLFEDVGKEETSFEKSVEAIKALVHFASLTEAESELNLEPPMDDKIWKWERELFAEHCLKSRYSLEMSEEIVSELEKVAAVLSSEPKALVHRDFQSTNILWKGEKLSFIDFQGMRMGPAIYDLASFVYDPYREFNEKEKLALIALYAKESGRMEVIERVKFAAVQRLIQCLGAYGRLSALGKSEFVKYFKSAWEHLLPVLKELGLENLSNLAKEALEKEKSFK